MAPLINIVINSQNNTQAGFAGVQQGLAGLTRSTQATTAAMTTSFRGLSTQLLGGLGIATGIGQVAGEIRQLASDGQDVQASLDRTRGSLGAVLGSQARANDIFEQASRFADRYKLTQEEMAGAIQASSQIIRTSQQPIENIMGTLARLQVLSPEQGLEGAALALRELTSGDTRSLVGRFEVSRDAANEMKRAIMGGADAVQVLGTYLDSQGITNGALEASLAGAAGQQKEWNRAIEGLGIAVNDVVTSTGWREYMTGVVTETTGVVGQLKTIAGFVKDNPVSNWYREAIRAIGQPILDWELRHGLADPRLAHQYLDVQDLHDRHPSTSPTTPTPTTPGAAAPAPVRFSGFDATPPRAQAVGSAPQAAQGRSPVASPQPPMADAQTGPRATPEQPAPFIGPRLPLAAPLSDGPRLTRPQLPFAAPPSAAGLASSQSPGPRVVRDVQIIVNIYPQGLVHSSRDLADLMRDAAKDDSFRNAIEVLGNR